jgi:hypothetical protein
MSVDDIPSCDWAVLEFQEDAAANSVQGLARHWAKASAGDICRVLGFPDGRDSFAGHGTMDIVKPNDPYGGMSKVLDAEGDLLRLHGVDTREGMSGGGVFRDADQSLVGLHRARKDPALQLYAVSAAAIALRLAEYQYKPSEVETGGGRLLTLPPAEPVKRPRHLEVAMESGKDLCEALRYGRASGAIPSDDTGFEILASEGHSLQFRVAWTPNGIEITTCPFVTIGPQRESAYEATQLLPYRHDDRVIHYCPVSPQTQPQFQITAGSDFSMRLLRTDSRDELTVKRSF